VVVYSELLAVIETQNWITSSFSLNEGQARLAGHSPPGESELPMAGLVVGLRPRRGEHRIRGHPGLPRAQPEIEHLQGSILSARRQASPNWGPRSIVRMQYV
jgi:hypothetical protein